MTIVQIGLKNESIQPLLVVGNERRSRVWLYTVSLIKEGL
jgi:hypothetical protein